MPPLAENPAEALSSGTDGGYDSQIEYDEAEEFLEHLTDDEEKKELRIWLGEKAYVASNECEADARYRWLEAAYDHLKAAYDLDQEDPDCLRCLAAATGRLAEDSGIRKKIHLGFEFKKYLDAAIIADPQNNPGNTFELYHMCGRFAYSVLSMSITERVLARVLGVVPEFTIDEAVEDLQKASILRFMPENELFLAKALILKGDKEEAKGKLLKALEGDLDVAIEQEYHREAQELLRMI